jgi:hypothetical protein
MITTAGSRIAHKILVVLEIATHRNSKVLREATGQGKVSGSSGRYGVVVVVWYIVGVLSDR